MKTIFGRSVARFLQGHTAEITGKLGHGIETTLTIDFV